MRVLLVDDNAQSLHSLEMVLRDLGHEPTPSASAHDALERLEREYFPLVVTDIRMPGINGLELLARIKNTHATRQADVVIITGHGDMETAVEALRKGAYDYLNKPVNARELEAVVERSAEHQALLSENREFKERFQAKVDEATDGLRQDLDQALRRLRAASGIDLLVARSPSMRRLIEEARIYHAEPDVPVLLEGETGAGKEIVARLIHFGENGNEAPFVAINCAAIPAALFESELFGHDPGAYTGSAPKGQPGKMELAANGTLFLDEVAELPLLLQPKLLRVLEDRTYYRVGGIRKREFTARVICAANVNLDQLVESGRFRRDLFHRLKVGYLRIPPLRQRPEDIPALALAFLQREARRKKKRFKDLAPDTQRILARAAWPGNVRELENVIERAVLTADGESLLPGHIAFLDSQPGTMTASPAGQDGLRLDPARLHLPESGLDLEALTLTIIRQALAKFKGNKTRAAEYLGMTRHALLRRLKKGLEETPGP